MCLGLWHSTFVFKKNKAVETNFRGKDGENMNHNNNKNNDKYSLEGDNSPSSSPLSPITISRADTTDEMDFGVEWPPALALEPLQAENLVIVGASKDAVFDFALSSVVRR